MKKTIYAGTYTSKTSKGIYQFLFEDGKLSDPSLLTEIKNPKYLTVQDNKIISLGDFGNRSGTAMVDFEGNIKDQISYEDRTSCYVTAKDNRIYTSNYHTGTFTVIENDEGKLKLIRTVEIQDGAGCHQVLLWNDKILIPSLFLDRVVIFNSDLHKEGSIHFEAGTGPRHGVFSKDGEYLYLVSELSNELFVIHTGDWKIVHTIPVLNNDEMHVRDTAAIRLSDDEKHLYVSTRTKDVLSVISLEDHVPTLIQNVSCGGKHPRDFILLDHYLLCANRNSNEVVSFALNEDGTIGNETDRIHIEEPVSLAVKSD